MTEQDPLKTKHYPWDETIRTIIIAVVLALSFRSLLFEPFNIPSGSMKSNLLVGDYLFVSKYSYGYSRYSFPLGFPLFEGRVLGNVPQRGDVIVFRLPTNPKIDFIKRLVGLPGDTVQVRGGTVFINGKPLPRERVADYAEDEGPPAMCQEYYADDATRENTLLSESPPQNANVVRPIPRFRETLPEGKTIEILKECKRSIADNTMVYRVPEGHYFFMGDNRDNSRDSRFLDEVGFVPQENLVGKAQIIFCSVEGGGSCFNPLNWFGKMRYDRFFTVID
jgi:signal peptidase I